ncbi:MAG TPA: hypothetical protein VEO20_04825 [Thermoplasmata archaeon]|nr:hypothetical protein [Thermoplasmata archaeon]
MKIELPEFLERLKRRLQKLPTAYTIGPVLFVIAFTFLIISLDIEVGIVDMAVAAGDAGPGLADRTVPFNVTSLFQAVLTVDACGIQFYLLTASAYQAYKSGGPLPPATLDCNRTRALVQDSIDYLVTNSSAPVGSANVTYVIDVSFLGPRSPYAVLSIPGATIALGVTIWVSITALARGTDKLIDQARSKIEKQKDKQKKK